MINSMTGYGIASCELEGICCTAEIKTVNNRYFKVYFKLPDAVAYLEKDIEKLCRKNISRGTVNFLLRFKDTSEQLKFAINEQALKDCVEKLSEIGKSAGVDSNINLADLLMLPGVIAPLEPDQQQGKRIAEAVMAATEQALENLDQMRANEGEALNAELDSHLKEIRENLSKITQRSGSVVGEYYKKIRTRVNDLLASAKLELNEDTLAREVAVFADRCDIREELARLESHLDQFVAACDTDAQAGRKLDFITQEMLREANTIASKSSDIEIARSVVDIKCWIDRLKEQIQNVE